MTKAEILKLRSEIEMCVMRPMDVEKLIDQVDVKFPEMPAVTSARQWLSKGRIEKDKYKNEKYSQLSLKNSLGCLKTLLTAIAKEFE